mmetsp:Transcript_5104/g.7771  ORF Transcript_5104/g.7771 Transcript_5104/m.7771 type:complete len:220 (+) Transcript_5104:39-698(+)
MNFSVSFYIEEDHNASDVINNAFFFTPPLEGGAYQVLGGTFGVLLQVEWIDNLCNVDVLKELPDSIARNYNYLVFFCELILAHFRLCVTAYRVSDCISEGPSHCEAWHVFAFKPDPQRPQRVALGISVRVNSSIISENAFSLVFVVRLMIPRQGLACALLTGLSSVVGSGLYYYTSGVTDVGNIQLPSKGHDTDAGRSTVPRILSHVADFFLGDYESCF